MVEKEKKDVEEGEKKRKKGGKCRLEVDWRWGGRRTCRSERLGMQDENRTDQNMERIVDGRL